MKMELTVSSETSVIRTQTPGNYPKRNKLHLEHGESLKTRLFDIFYVDKELYLNETIKGKKKVSKYPVPFYLVAFSQRFESIALVLLICYPFTVRTI